MKKRILIGISIILIVALGTAAALYFFAKPRQSPAATDLSITIPDTSADYGACDLLDVSTIKTKLGSVASSLHDGFDSGKVNTGGGGTAQNCIYGFNSAVIAINETMLNDTFYTGVNVFNDQASKDALTATSPDAVEVTDLGDKASFTVSKSESSDTTEYKLRVDYGARYFTYAIRQLNASDLVTESTAKTALIELAKTVDYTKFQDVK